MHIHVRADSVTFMQTYQKPQIHIDNVISQHNKGIIVKNRKFLTSIIKCVELCGRNGMAL